MKKEPMKLFLTEEEPGKSSIYLEGQKLWGVSGYEIKSMKKEAMAMLSLEMLVSFPTPCYTGLEVGPDGIKQTLFQGKTGTIEVK